MEVAAASVRTLGELDAGQWASSEENRKITSFLTLMSWFMVITKNGLTQQANCIFVFPIK